MDIWELQIREQVRDLYTRYSMAADTGRLDEVVATFALDAVFAVPPFPSVTGGDAIAVPTHPSGLK